jgi:hypothetical protein
VMSWSLTDHLPAIDQRLEFYRQSDEKILGRLTSLDQRQIARLCLESRQLAGVFHGLTPVQLAAREGCRIIEESFSIAAGRLQLMGECDFAPGRPPQILINRGAIDRVSRLALAQVGSSSAEWFQPSCLVDLTIAHELHHPLTRQAVTPVSELGAHIFVRAFTAWPFSPLLLHVLLQKDP